MVRIGVGPVLAMRVAKWETRKAWRSGRLAVAIAAFMVLVLVAIPVALYLGQAHDPFDVMAFWHVVRDTSDGVSPLLAFYTLSAWGQAIPGYPVTVFEIPNGIPRILETDTGGSLFVPLDANSTYEVRFEYRQYPETIYLGPGDFANATMWYDVKAVGTHDLDFDRRAESQLLHAVHGLGGQPATELQVWRNESFQGNIDEHGYFRVILPEGPSEVIVRNATSTVLDLFLGSQPGMRSPALPARQGQAFVGAYLWNSPAINLVPLISLAIGMEMLAAERSFGTLDLLRVRPISRRALCLGKIAGATLSLLVASVLATCGIALVGSLAYGGPIPLVALVGFLIGVLFLGVVFALVAQLLSFIFQGTTNAFIASAAIWVILGPAWGTIGLPRAGPWAMANPFYVANGFVGLMMPQAVVFAWDSFLPQASVAGTASAVAMWLAALIILALLSWHVSGLPWRLNGFGRSRARSKEPD